MLGALRGGRDWWLVPRMAATLVVLCVLSLVVVATAVAVVGAVSWLALLLAVGVLAVFVGPVVGGGTDWVTPLIDYAPETILLIGLVLVPSLYLRPVRARIRAFRSELGATGQRAGENYPEVAATASRLAQQAGVAEPDVYVADRHRPESYAIGGRSDGTIVVTKGLVSDLSTDELTAVLAHEVSHLVNGDSRIMGLALTPMLLAERVGSEEPPDLQWVVRSPLTYLASLAAWAAVTALTRAQRLCSRLAVAVLSRQRELAADRGAATLTGAPGDLASALRTLDGGRSRPDTDKRTWARSASALDILPREGSPVHDGPFRTHPATEDRIERLERMAVETETGSPMERSAYR